MNSTWWRSWCGQGTLTRRARWGLMNVQMCMCRWPGPRRSGDGPGLRNRGWKADVHVGWEAFCGWVRLLLASLPQRTTNQLHPHPAHALPPGACLQLGAGLSAVQIRDVTVGGASTSCFFLLRKDGSQEDVSYRWRSGRGHVGCSPVFASALCRCWGPLLRFACFAFLQRRIRGCMRAGLLAEGQGGARPWWRAAWRDKEPGWRQCASSAVNARAVCPRPRLRLLLFFFTWLRHPLPHPHRKCVANLFPEMSDLTAHYNKPGGAGRGGRGRGGGRGGRGRGGRGRGRGRH